ncbi:hypothetical protein WPS_20890 [Vulcanimicrobium alpinum]|uniref:Uncharacterized protein n=1 Tax=Vulcanimicrobium alpinum TaxID=3016050 RepID=A0AAN1XWS2_UNVUL|nr:hypothetical protein [Vulcanimicrobium alpinum]BDE06813.1 hypothetical protein WPS_20890 [Vulcanimicrobium alpinum]
MWVLFVVLALVAVAAGVAVILRNASLRQAVGVRNTHGRDRSADRDDGIEYDDDVAYDVVGEATLRRAAAASGAGAVANGVRDAHHAPDVSERHEPEVSPNTAAETDAHAGHASDPPAITWPQRFDPRVGELDDEARIRLLGDLAIVRAVWCLPILELATREETAPEVLAAARAALAACAPRATEGAGAPRR